MRSLYLGFLLYWFVFKEVIKMLDHCKKCVYFCSIDEDPKKISCNCSGVKCPEYVSCKEYIHNILVPDLIRSGKKGMIL